MKIATWPGMGILIRRANPSGNCVLSSPRKFHVDERGGKRMNENARSGVKTVIQGLLKIMVRIDGRNSVPEVWSLALLMVSAIVDSTQAGSENDLLFDSEGKRITTEAHWQTRRTDLLEQVATYIYGHLPAEPMTITVKETSERSVLDGKATEKLAVLSIQRGDRRIPVRFGVIRPTTNLPVPVIIKNDRWRFDLSDIPPGETRDMYVRSGRKEIFEKILPKSVERGYAICKFIRVDVAADESNSRQTGVLALYPEYDWGAIAAWAWCYQPLIDYLIAEENIHPEWIIATGHSRGGKAALAAAIFDPRIGVAAPSASGSGGTGSWRFFTEGGSRQTSDHFTIKRPYWFSPRLKELSSKGTPPLDGHTLRALIAPRGIINTLGADDPLSNPLGTKRMFDASEPVFELLGVGGRTATHWRKGGHGQTVEDWEAVLDYADAFFSDDDLPDRFNNWPEEAR